MGFLAVNKSLGRSLLSVDSSTQMLLADGGPALSSDTASRSPSESSTTNAAVPTGEQQPPFAEAAPADEPAPPPPLGGTAEQHSQVASRSAQAKDWAQKRAEAIAKAARLRAERMEKPFGMVHIDFLDRLSVAEQRDQGTPAPSAPPPRKTPLPARKSPLKRLKKLASGGRPSSPLKKKRAAEQAAKQAEQAVLEQKRRETKPSASDPARELAQHGYETLGPIAAGAFSTILRARPPDGADCGGGAEVAVKTFDNAKCDKTPLLGDARDRELGVLRLLSEAAARGGGARHRHIAYMLAEHAGPNTHHAVLQYCPGGSLLRHMQILQKTTRAPARGAAAHSAAGSASESVGMPEGPVARVTAQVASALEYLHSLEVAHRDVKPGNILFDNEGGAHNEETLCVKLCDFGFASKCGNRALKKLMGTPSYIAPELTGSGLESGYRGRPVDMWALGVVLFEILHGRPPFYGANLEQLETRIRAVSHAPFDAGVSAGAKGLVLSLLKADPSKRLTARATLKQKWLKPYVRSLQQSGIMVAAAGGSSSGGGSTVHDGDRV